ncbi:hypothetical protein [Aquimarina sp. I32.4]|uniref:hypothetical protein n=1 Tax=Aquimarina sp. I32.4 TaxID=2053903 RepID=UPI000CDED9F2|nr:hypothetical protein [Aquimarina sp. I32.4]
MIERSEGKKILKKSITGLSFVNKTIKKEIDRDIEECLTRQKKDMDEIVDDLNNIIKIKFTSITEFQVFVLKNIKFTSF